MFNTPKLPEAPQSPVQYYSAADQIDKSVEQERARLAKKRGRAANVLTMDYAGNQKASDILGV